MLHTDSASHRQLLLSRVALPISLMFVLALCAAHPAFAQTVSVESDESVDFAKFKTFTVRDGKLSSRSPALNSPLTKKRIETEIEQALTAKGLTVATDQADLNISFEFGSARTMETKSYPVGWRGRGTRVVNVPQSEGTLVIDMLDASTNSLVWRGITSESEPNPIKLADKLDDLVKKAIGKYPKLKKK